MILDKMLKRTDGDMAFKKLAKEYREQAKDLEKVKDYAVGLQQENLKIKTENAKLKSQLSHSKIHP